MTWQQRCKILKDACRGLAWLHGADPPMIHQDIKSYVHSLAGAFIVIMQCMSYAPFHLCVQCKHTNRPSLQNLGISDLPGSWLVFLMVGLS